ncbi:MAG: hypothetical protein LBU12_05370 [Deltaproteobacteria bacterium]|jgi:shikimate kinase/3-dehydroquinate synthase|nr:hypothetical protein [Deltaproteobacteria bacterium]
MTDGAGWAELSPAERPVFLVGFMAAGKTTVGRRLAELLRRPFVDCDEELQRRLGRAPAEIFSAEGEAFFRAAEKAFLAELAAQDRPLVVATGGGLCQDPENRRLLQTASTFFLDLPPETLWARLTPQGQAQRPLAATRAAFDALWLRRRPQYRDCGRTVAADDPPEATARLIEDLLLAAEPLTLTAEGRQTVIRTHAPAEKLPALAADLVGGRRVLTLLDRFFQAADDPFPAAFPGAPLHRPEAQGEAAKTFAEAQRLLTIMVEARLDRGDFLAARGGGSLTDLGAFCAGLFRRGLNLILSPTTLLGAVDAAVGGKAAVNLAGAKNQVGLFHLPREVWIDPTLLSRLPPRLLAEGLTEAYKTGLLFEPALAALIERRLPDLLRGDAPLLNETIRRSVQAKAALVEQDFREEKGLRDVLNLGHTYGHVVESHHGPAVSHGRAVALGLAAALEFSKQRLGFDAATALRGQRLCLALAGGRFPPAPPPAEAQRLLSFDKKIRGGRLKFAALAEPGRPLIVEAAPEAILDAAAAAVQAVAAPEAVKDGWDARPARADELTD